MKAPLYEPDGAPSKLRHVPRPRRTRAQSLMSRAAIEERYAATMQAQASLRQRIEAARLDALIIIGDDQRELFQDECRPAIAVYYGDTIRNAAQPAALPDDWYKRAGMRRRPEGADMHYPCHGALGRYLIEGLGARGFDVTAVRALVGEQSEGHAYNSIQSLYLAGRQVPIVPIMLNTYYPPNQPTPARSLELGIAIGELAEQFPGAARIGIMASGGLEPLHRARGVGRRSDRGVEAQGYGPSRGARPEAASRRHVRNPQLDLRRGRRAQARSRLDRVCGGLSLERAYGRRLVLCALVLRPRPRRLRADIRRCRSVR